MCGIFVASGSAIDFSHRTLDSLQKRGPDNLGFWTNGDTHFGHTRLAILGLDRESRQPIENERYVLTFNGEIYNYIALRNRLRAEGIVFRSTGDTEVLLEAWTRWGHETLHKLVGFWAFAVYDKQEQRLTLVRDQLGIKPLYYYDGPEGFFGASMLKTIVEALPHRLELDYMALSEYVRYQFTFGEKTFFKGLKKVEPGTMVGVDLRTRDLTVTCYEDILTPDVTQGEPLSAEWQEECRHLLVQCVQESTISDTSFTTFCSGGLDSSLITRIAMPEMAYHCNYADPQCNETFFAKQVVEDTPIRLFVVNAQEEALNIVARLESIVEDFDELSVGSVVLPLDDLLAQVGRRHKVILTGTGGDELFAGYMRYQLTEGVCQQASYRVLFERLQQAQTKEERFEMTHRKGDVSLYTFYDTSARDTFRAGFDTCRNGGSILEGMLRFDRRYFLQGLLNIDDKMAARYSVESRPSFLHQDLVRHVVKLDPAALFQGHALKPLLRKQAEPYVPQSIVYRADKMGFTTPVGTFINKALHLIRERVNDSPFRHLYRTQHRDLTASSKFSRETFGLLMLDLWLNQYAGSA